MEKYKINKTIQQTLNNIFYKYKENSKLFKITDYGIELNNYYENNHKLFKIDDNLLFYNDLLGIISYYMNHNNWKIRNHNNNTLINLNKTLSYALKICGSIYEIKLTDDGPYFILHINTDYINENGFFIDENVKYNSFIPLYRWLVYITDYFNLYYIYFYTKGNNKIIFLNKNDCPILLKENINQIDEKYPIYSWTTTINHFDILLPLPDIIMWLFKREFYYNIDITNFKKFENKTNNKCIFRGNMTNELRIKAHIISLNNMDKFDFITSIGKPKLIFSNDLYLSDEQNIENFNNTQNNYLTIKQQQEYKYILNIDGVSSAWRIFNELYYNSIIFAHNSKYIDIVKESLKKNIHYVEINEDLSNINQIYDLITNNIQLSNNIILNLNNFANALNNIDIHLRIMYEKIEKKNYNIKYNDLININYNISKFSDINIKNNLNNINYDNIYIKWKCYITQDFFNKKLMKNLKENKNKFVLCCLKENFIDNVYAISKCYNYCQKSKRKLLINDPKNINYEKNFFEIFDIIQNNKFYEPEIIYNFDIINNILNVNDNVKNIQFDFDKDYDDNILYYSHHRNSDDILNKYFLKNIKFKNENSKNTISKLYDELKSISINI